MGKFRSLLSEALTRLLGLAALDRIAELRGEECGSRSIFQLTGQRLGVVLKFSGKDAARIPTDGPVIAYANHPTGAAEGVLLPAILDAVRPDVKVLAHTWFQRWPELARRMILIDPQAVGANRATKTRALKSAVRWVREGHLLFLFPAGEVARRPARYDQATDVEWHSGLANLVRLTHATVLPIYVSGRNSWLYYLLSALHPRLGALLLGREVLNKRGSGLQVCVGRPIRYRDLPPSRSAEELTAHLRQAVEDLAPYTPRGGHSTVSLGRVWV